MRLVDADMKGAKNEMTINVYADIKVSDDTVKRCLKLIDIWQESNPDKYIEMKVSDKGIHYEICWR